MPPSASRRPALIGLGLLLAVRAALALWHFRLSGGFPIFLSSAELLRALLSLVWARAPTLNVDVMWLPGSFWIYGTALRLREEPLAVLPLLNTLFTLGSLCCLFLLTELLTDSAVLALASAAYAAFQAESLILGTGATADPLLHLSILASVYCWARSLKSGDFPWMLAASALIAAGCLARYEAWLIAAGLGASWIAGWPAQRSWSRRLAPLVVLSAPVLGWLVLQAAHGAVLGFLTNALQAHDADFVRLSVPAKLVSFLGGLEAPPLVWLGRLLPALAWFSAVRRRNGGRVWRSVALLVLWFIATYLALGLFVQTQVDLHAWTMTLLTAPFVPWFVARELSPLRMLPRRAALAGLVAALLVGEAAGWRRLTRLRPLRAAALRTAEAVRDCLPDERGAKVLVEAFPLAGNSPEHVVQQGTPLLLGLDRVLFDRACDIESPVPCSEQRPRMPSILRLPARDLSSWLSERGVLVIVTSSGEPPPPGYETLRFGSGDVLVARERPALKSCLASKTF
ncbi:MAG TPA: glycosyltransferase family 39 protein [Elusimicrobiota bacterium]|nr:glycosyltransferase family 39 protein [Elusimicrobiota bacterium]